MSPLPLTFTLVFFLVAGFLLACLIILWCLSSSKQSKGWYAFFILSFIGWILMLTLQPHWVGGFWLFVLPVLWVAGSLKASSPLTSHTMPPPKDPIFHATQEQLKGPAGTREALGLYFLLLTLGLLLCLILGFAFFPMTYP